MTLGSTHLGPMTFLIDSQDITENCFQTIGSGHSQSHVTFIVSNNFFLSFCYNIWSSSTSFQVSLSHLKSCISKSNIKKRIWWERMSTDNLIYSSSGHLYYLLNSIQIGKKKFPISSITRDCIKSIILETYRKNIKAEL